MAQTNPFDYSPLDIAAQQAENDSGLLPGQQPVKAAPALQMQNVPARADVQQAATPAPMPSRQKKAGADSLLPPADQMPIFEAAAQHFDVPVNVLMALGQKESNYRADAIGVPTKWGRAKGVMQNLDSTAKGLGINALDPAEAIPAAAKQLRERLDAGATMKDAVMEHFAGPDRKQWGPKTARYGDEVMAKVDGIGQAYASAKDAQGGPTKVDPAALQKQLDAEEPGRYKVLPEGYADSHFGAAMPRDTYEQTFRSVNPGASDAAVANAMAQFDKQKQAGAKADPVGARFDTLKSPEATFNARLNQRLQGRQNGVVPQLPANMQRLPELETPAIPDNSIGDDAADAGRNLKVGANMAAQDMRELLGRVPVVGQSIVRAGDAVDMAMSGKPSEQLLADDTKLMVDSMTPAMKAAQAKKWWDSDKGTFGQAWGDPRSYASGVLQSLPEQALTMAPAMALAKYAYGAKIAAGVGEAAAATAASRTAMVAGALSEGALGGAQSAREVRQQVAALPQSVLDQSDAYKSLVVGGMSQDEARKALSENLATRAFVTSGIVTGLFGGMGDRTIAKLFTEQVGGSAIKRALKGFGQGALAEGVFEELPQSAGQQLAQNEAVQQANPNQRLGEDVINQSLGGMVQGGLQGGGMGAVAGRMARSTAPAQETPPQLIPAPTVVRPVATASTAPGPMSRAAENAAEQHAGQPDRVTATAPNGEQVSGQMQGYQEDADGNFIAQVVGDDGAMHTLDSRTGVVVEQQATPDAGPLSTSLSNAAEQHEQQTAATKEQASRDTLRQLGQISNDLFGGKHPNAIDIGTQDGSFAGTGLLDIDDAGNVVLRRAAHHEQHLDKDGKAASVQEMMDSSLYSGGAPSAGAIHTSGLANFHEGAYSDRELHAVYRIPVTDLLDLAKQGKAILGNLSEGEVVLSGDVAKKYLSEINGKPAAEFSQPVQPMEETNAQVRPDNTVDGRADVSPTPPQQPAVAPGVAPAEELDQPGRPTVAAGAESSAGAGVVRPGAAADAQPALKNPYHAYSAASAERAQAYMDKRGADPAKFEVKQTGKVRWQVVPKESVEAPAAQPKVMDEETYLSINGASKQGYGDAALHRSSSNVSESARKYAIERQSKLDSDLSARREELRAEYAGKVAAGELRPPTSIEQAERTASGHPDNEATQAAKRILEKQAARKAAAKKVPEVAPKYPAPTRADRDTDDTYNSRVDVNSYMNKEIGRTELVKRFTGREMTAPQAAMILSRVQDTQLLSRIEKVIKEPKDKASVGNKTKPKQEPRRKNDPPGQNGIKHMEDTSDSISPEEAEAVQKSVEGKTPIQVADWLAKEAPNEAHREVAKKVAESLRRMQSEGARLSFRVVHMGDLAPVEVEHALANTHFGVNADRNPYAVVTVNGADVAGRVGVGYEPIIHELVHAATAIGIEMGRRPKFKDSVFGHSVEDLKNILELVDYTVKQRIEDGTANRFEKRLFGKANNGMTDIHEIVAWSLANKDMQRFMESIPYSGQTLWSKFVEVVRKVLGMQARSDTALSEVLHIAEKVINTSLASYTKDMTYNPSISFVQPSFSKVLADNITPQMREKFKADAFDKEQIKSEAGSDTLTDVRQAWDDAGIKNHISERNGTINLSQIVVLKDERSTGKGSAAMQRLVDYADKTGQRITLSPSADFGGNKARLVQFYKRLGFVENKGRNNDYAVSESMYRDPVSADDSGSPRQSQTGDAKASGSLDKAGLKDAVTRGALGKAVGAMIDAGVVVLHDTTATLPDNVGRNIKGIQAVTTRDGTIHLVASNLTPANASAVLMHEAFHQGAEKLMGEQWADLMKRLGSLYRQGQQTNGKAREFFDKARARVASAKGKGGVAANMEVEEFAAYAIEEYESAPTTVRKWIDDLVGMVKAWLSKRFGKQLGGVTPAQLSAIAKMALMDSSVESNVEAAGAGGVFSINEKESINKDIGIAWPKDTEEGANPDGITAYVHGHDSKAFVSAEDNADGSYSVQESGLPPEMRGKGYGVRMYVALIDELAKRGQVLTSDVSVSKDAQHVYDALEKRGYKIERNENVTVDKETGALESDDGRPVYTVAAGPDGAKYSVADDTPPAPNAYTPPEQGLLRRVQAAIQDNMNRVKQVQEKIREITGDDSLGRSDYYAAETNRPGRIAARLEDAQDKMTGPLMAELAKSGYKPAQLSELLHAQHAEERNKAVAKINPDMPDGGSGMATDVAQAIIENYKNAAPLQALAKKARSIAKATLDLKLAYGLIKPADHDMLATMYENYVPLKGDGEYGPKIKRAMGHEDREEHILENIARDYDQAVVTGEKNLARQALLRMVLKYLDSELWTASVPPRGRYIAGKSYSVQKNGVSEAVFTSMSQVSAFLEAKGAAASNYTVMDSAGERVVEFTKPLQDNEVMVYVNGDPVRIQIHDEKLAAQLRPLDVHQIGPILENFRKVNRYLSMIYTGYNPAFILRNATRDAVTGTINMLGNEGAMVAAKAWSKYPGALAALGQWAATKKVPNTAAGRYLVEYRNHGGKTGASHMSDLDQQVTKLQTMFDDAYGAGGYLRDGMAGKAAKVAGRKIVGGMAHVVEVANQATENGLRLGLYIALRENGASRDNAAQAAKNVTVNFDRKGSSTASLGAIYLFFNPAVQGTANAMKTLFHGKHKEQAWAALGGLAMLGFLAASKGMDDDKDRWLGDNWDIRTKNFIINTPSHQLRAPMSQEFAPAYAFGVAMAEASRGESKTRSAARIVSSFIDAYFPLQGAFREESDNHLADAAQAATPTVLKPLVESAMNRNAFGSQMVPESELTKDKPDNLKMNRGTKNTAYDKAAQGIASAGELFGAGKYENDITKVSPETLKSLWRTYTGGLGTFVADSIGVAGMAGRDASQVESSDIPIVKDFYRTATVSQIRSRYYDLTKEAKAAITEFEQAKKLGDGEEMEKIAGTEDKAKLIGLGRMVRSTSKAAAQLGDAKVEINTRKDLPDAEKRAELKNIERQEEELYRAAIEAFK